MGEREPLIPPIGIHGNAYSQQPTPAGNMLSVSDDSEYYKEKRGSISLLQILEGLPDDKSSRASSKERIISGDSDEDSDDEISDSIGSTGPVDSYDLMKSPEPHGEQKSTDPEAGLIVVLPPPEEGGRKADGIRHDDESDLFPTIPSIHDDDDDDDQFQSTRL